MTSLEELTSLSFLIDVFSSVFKSSLSIVLSLDDILIQVFESSYTEKYQFVDHNNNVECGGCNGLGVGQLELGIEIPDTGPKSQPESNQSPEVHPNSYSNCRSLSQHRVGSTELSHDENFCLVPYNANMYNVN